jgi:hypothetical protein
VTIWPIFVPCSTSVNYTLWLFEQYLLIVYLSIVLYKPTST